MSYSHGHGGHRERMKSALLKNGADKLEDLHLLEMLLFYVVPRLDTRATAQQLLDKFGSLNGIIYAEKGEVSKIKGLKDNAEILFMLLREVLERCDSEKEKPILFGSEKLERYLIDLYRGVTEETVYALYFANNGSFAGHQMICHGGVYSVKFSLRVITEGVFRSGGNSVVLAHNHPSGKLVPSQDDLISTKQIATHLAANEITLAAHYLVGDNEAVAFYRYEE